MRNGGKARKEEETFKPVAEGDRSVALSCSDIGLQEAPPTAVTSAAEAEGERLCLPQQSSQHLSLLPIQQQPLAPDLSADDGSASSLSSLLGS